MARLVAQLESIALRSGVTLVEPGGTTDHVYFPEAGLVSLVVVMDDGRMVEVGVVGLEGMVGVSEVLGMFGSPFQAVVQVPGHGKRLSRPVLQRELEQVPVLKDLILRYMHHRVAQIAQTAACNRLHRVPQRCCRWLLTADDSVQTDSFALTHEFLALMMGVNRPTLSRALASLRREGLIDYRYGIMTIKDRRTLKARSCVCYETMRRDAELVYQLT